MKQRITMEQLNELSDEQKERLREWWKPADGDLFTWKWHQQFEGGEIVEEIGIYIEGEIRSCHEPDENSLPLLSIGQMIELINDQKYIKFGKLEDIAYDNMQYHGIGNRFFLDLIDTSEKRKIQYREFGEMVDAIWSAIKQIL